MFRPMRRYKQQLSEKETTTILEQGKTGVLGVIGDEGYPYTVPNRKRGVDKGFRFLHGEIKVLPLLGL